MTWSNLNRTRPARRVAHLAALAGAVAAAMMAPIGPAWADDDPPSEDMTDRRIAGWGDNQSGRSEAGVDITGIGGLINAADGPSGGGGGGAVSGCAWAVVYAPGAGTDANVAALERASQLRGLEPVPGTDQSWMESSLDTLAHDLVTSGAATSDNLRYVTPYAPPAGVDPAECNTSPGVWITLAEVEDLALVAFSEVEENWPAQDVELGWPEPTEDTWTALSTGMSWTPLSATASSGGLSVTVTATPVSAEWDIGEVNTRVGGPGAVVCDGPGDLPVVQDEASCRVWFAGPSTGLVDRAGQEGAITLGVTVRWQVGYTSNFAGFADPDWLVWPTTSSLDGVVVNTSQSVASTGAGSGA